MKTNKEFIDGIYKKVDEISEQKKIKKQTHHSKNKHIISINISSNYNRNKF